MTHEEFDRLDSHEQQRILRSTGGRTTSKLYPSPIKKYTICQCLPSDGVLCARCPLVSER